MAPANKRRKKGKKHDMNIVRTMPDRRRATGGQDDDEWSELDAEVTVPRKRKRIKEESQSWFPFLTLSSEIRNMIYRYIVLSNAPIDLGFEELQVNGNIETAILRANKQLYAEAKAILYSENKFIAIYQLLMNGGGRRTPISFRKDDVKTLNMTTRTLRSGREVAMAESSGFIPEQSLQLLRHVTFKIMLAAPKNLPDEGNCHQAALLQEKFSSLYYILLERLMSTADDEYHISPNGRDWVLEICSEEDDPSFPQQPEVPFLKQLLEPLLSVPIRVLVRGNWLSVKVTGSMPAGYKSMFRFDIDTTGVPALEAPTKTIRKRFGFYPPMDSQRYWEKHDDLFTQDHGLSDDEG